MSLIRWEPFHEIERLFEADFPYMPMVPTAKFGWDLAVDLYQEKGNLIAEMSLPGIDPNKVEVTFLDGDLKITGRREEVKEIKDKNYFCKEIKRGEFERLVTLPSGVKTDRAEAHYDKGVLRIVMPMKEEVKHERIKVKVQ